MTETIDLYGKYINERLGLSLLREDHGFLSYRIDPGEKDKTLFVEDVYVEPEHRKGPTFFKLARRAEQIGRDAGCRFLMGVVYTATTDPTLSAKAIMSYGLKIIAADVGKIYFSREIEGV